MVYYAIVLTVLLALGVRTHIRAWDWTSDIVIWQSAARLSPYKPRPQYNYGLHEEYAGNYGRAQTAYQRAIILSLSSSRNHYQQGHIYVASSVGLARVLAVNNEVQPAFDILDKVIKVYPDAADAVFLKGTILSALGRCEQGQALITKARLLRPDLAAFPCPSG